jgi:hypothetical protein
MSSEDSQNGVATVGSHPDLALVGSDVEVPLATGQWRRYINLDYAASAPCLVAVKQAIDDLLPWRRGRLTVLPVPTSPAEALDRLDHTLKSAGPGPRLVTVTGASNVTGEIWPYAQDCPAGARARRAYRARRRSAGSTPSPRHSHRRHRLPRILRTQALRPVRSWCAGRSDWLAAGELGMARDRLAAVPGVQHYQMWTRDHPRIAVLPFALASVPYAQLAAVLSAEYGIGLWHGCICAHPLMAHLLAIDPAQSADLIRGIRRGEPVAKPGAVRTSLGLGITVTDIDYRVDALTSLVIDGPRWSYRSTPDGSDCWPEPDPIPRWSGCPILHR